MRYRSKNTEAGVEMLPVASTYRRVDSPFIWIRYKSDSGTWKSAKIGTVKDNIGDRKQAELKVTSQMIYSRLAAEKITRHCHSIRSKRPSEGIFGRQNLRNGIQKGLVSIKGVFEKSKRFLYPW
jgi:hypothetical protein